MKKQRNYYEEINKEIKGYEEYKPYHTRTLSWCADRIDWCYKWKKITKSQMNELCERMIVLFER